MSDEMKTCAECLNNKDLKRFTGRFCYDCRNKKGVINVVSIK